MVQETARGILQEALKGRRSMRKERLDELLHDLGNTLNPVSLTLMILGLEVPNTLEKYQNSHGVLSTGLEKSEKLIRDLIFPVLNQTLWRDWEDRPVLGRFRELGLMLAISTVVVALVLTGNVNILVPLALLSVVGVLAMLMALNTTVLLLAIRRENRATNWAGALTPLLAGFTLTMIEIGMIDLVRFSIFHTWSGFGVLN